MVIGKAPGEITAEISRQGLTARILIRFNQAGWVIDRVETSEGFHYRPEPPPTGSIHRRYNLWVETLDGEIRSALTRTLQTPAAETASAAQETTTPATEAAPQAIQPSEGSGAPADPSGAPEAEPTTAAPTVPAATSAATVP